MLTIPDEVLITINRCLLVLSQFVRQTDKLSYRAVAERISQSAVEGLVINRASVWALNPDLDIMECVALYVDDRFISSAQLPTLHEKDFPAYFKALKEDRFIIAQNAREHPDTFEFAESYLKPLNIFSMLDVPIRQNGKVVGILCCEHTGSIRIWDLLSQNYAGMLADIAERALAEMEIKKLALYDSLTLLPNRSKLLRDIKETTSNAIIIFDIVAFTSINDIYGEKNGDMVLKHVAHYLVGKTKQIGTIYRYGNDQFALLFSSSKADRGSIKKRILSVCKELETFPCVVDEISISISMVFSVSYESKDTLISTANLALKELKKSNLSYYFYNKDHGLEAVIANNIYWTKKIKMALNSGSLICVFQPIMNNATKDIVKYESLVRISDSNGELISPSCFLEIAKMSKQYSLVSLSVLRYAFDKFRNKSCSFSINLTMEDMVTPEVIELIEKELENTCFSGRVIFEIVENEALDKSEAVIAFLEKVRSLGAKVAIDDFGTGYSNFEYLIRLSPDFIKIDGSMIKELNTNKVSEDVVKTIVDLAKKQGIEVIAEYVHSEVVFDKVCSMGIDYSQGYYIGQPKQELITNANC